MKYLIILMLFLSGCKLSEKRWNKQINKAIEKGWMDTTSKSKIDTLIKIQTDSIEIQRIINETILKDTCYSKEQKFIGFKSNPEKLKKELSKFKCLPKPIFIIQKGIIFELYQDSIGNFKIKFESPKYIIKKQNESTKFEKYFEEVWFMWLIIVILILIIVLKK